MRSTGNTKLDEKKSIDIKRKIEGWILKRHQHWFTLYTPSYTNILMFSVFSTQKGHSFPDKDTLIYLAKTGSLVSVFSAVIFPPSSSGQRSYEGPEAVGDVRVKRMPGRSGSLRLLEFICAVH